MAEEQTELELLFEIQGSSKPLFVSSESVVCEVEKELELSGMNGVLAYFSCPRGQHLPYKNVYILQRWNKRWGKFVDVMDITEVLDGDRLTISSQPTPTRLHSTKADSGDSVAAKTFDVERGQVSYKYAYYFFLNLCLP